MKSFDVFSAWKWLLAHLVIAASMGYLASLLLVGLGVISPATLMKSTALGLPHIGAVIKTRGVSLGLDEGLMIFFCNLFVALLIVALVFWARLLNPHNQSPTFLSLRRHLQRDRSAKHLLRVKPFAQIPSAQLRVSSFLLLGAPYIATITLGLMAGGLLGVGHIMSSSPIIALAYLLPHGLPEIAALLLACSLPVGIWMSIRPMTGDECSQAAFRRIERVVASRHFQKHLKMIFNLLMIAGMVEAHITSKVVALLSRI